MWDKIILFNDSLFLNFIIIAFLIKNKEKYINLEPTFVPTKIGQLIFENTEEIDEIISLALDLKYITPKSYYIFGNFLEIFNYKSKKLKNLFENINPNEFVCMPIFPNEFLYYYCQDKIFCIDNNCPCFMNKIQICKNPYCFYCNLNYNSKEIKENYLLIDFRIKDIKEKKSINNILKTEDIEKSCGYLNKNIIFLDFENLNLNINYNNNDDDDNKLIFENFEILYNQIKDKINNKFLIFLCFETSYYKEKNNIKFLQKITKNNFINIYSNEKNTNFINSDLIYSKNEIKKYIFEFNYMNEFIKYLMFEKKIKHISYIYGGFKDIHNLMLNYNISLNNHGGNCILCKRKIKDFLEIKNIEKNENIILKFLSKNFSFKKDKNDLEIKNKIFDDLFNNNNELTLKKIEELIKNKEDVFCCSMNDLKLSNNFKCFIIINISNKTINLYKINNNYEKYNEYNQNEIYKKILNLKCENIVKIINDKKIGKNLILIFYKIENEINQLLILKMKNMENLNNFINKIKKIIDKIIVL